MDADADYYERCGYHPTVAAAWLLSGNRARASLVPADGCFDFIVEEDVYGRRSAFVYTPVTKAHWVRSEVGTRVFGVRVQSGHGASVVDCESELRQLVEPNRDEGSIFLNKLESLVASSANTCSPPDIIREFVSSARATEGCQRLTSPSSGKVERELQRACRRWLGLPPKVFLRIERAWAARHAIRMGHPLAAVAANLGYADQAHLTREVRHLLGVTPRELRPVGILQESGTRNR